MNIYERHGHTDRNAYFKSLADDYFIALSDVIEIAGVLGENEDFDQLPILCDELNESMGGTEPDDEDEEDDDEAWGITAEEIYSDHPVGIRL